MVPEGGSHSRNSVDLTAEARRSHRDDSVALLAFGGDKTSIGALDR